MEFLLTGLGSLRAGVLLAAVLFLWYLKNYRSTVELSKTLGLVACAQGIVLGAVIFYKATMTDWCSMTEEERAIAFMGAIATVWTSATSARAIAGPPTSGVMPK